MKLTDYMFLMSLLVLATLLTVMAFDIRYTLRLARKIGGRVDKWKDAEAGATEMTPETRREYFEWLGSLMSVSAGVRRKGLLLGLVALSVVFAGLFVEARTVMAAHGSVSQLARAARADGTMGALRWLEEVGLDYKTPGFAYNRGVSVDAILETAVIAPSQQISSTIRAVLSKAPSAEGDRMFYVELGLFKDLDGAMENGLTNPGDGFISVELEPDIPLPFDKADSQMGWVMRKPQVIKRAGVIGLMVMLGERAFSEQGTATVVIHYEMAPDNFEEPIKDYYALPKDYGCRTMSEIGRWELNLVFDGPLQGDENDDSVHFVSEIGSAVIRTAKPIGLAVSHGQNLSGEFSGKYVLKVSSDGPLDAPLAFFFEQTALSSDMFLEAYSHYRSFLLTEPSR